MNLFCKHKWEITDTDFTPPLSDQSKVWAFYVLRRVEPLLYGVTHIYLKCEKCGDIKQKKVVGKFVNNDN